MKEVVFRDWKLLINDTETKQAYLKAEFSPCDCVYCKNFEAYKEQVFPDEVRRLLEDLCIDYRKYAEIYHIYEDPERGHVYGGFYHFKGSFV